MPPSPNNRKLSSRYIPGFFIFRIAKQSRALALLMALFLEIILQPISDSFPQLTLILQLGIILAAIFMVADSKDHFIAGLALGIPAIILLIANKDNSYNNATWVAYGLILGLYLHVIRLMMMQIFRAVKVTMETITLAMCTFVLLGTLWSLLYIPVAVFDPNAFAFPSNSSVTSLYDQLSYFSFVTLTTLGYGDIQPLSQWARSLAILESLTGTLFMAVLISRLVGSYSSSRRSQ